jgi:hypothetical protein
MSCEDNKKHNRDDLQRLTIMPIECHGLPSERYKIMTSILFKNMGRPWQIEQVVTILWEYLYAYMFLQETVVKYAIYYRQRIYHARNILYRPYVKPVMFLIIFVIPHHFKLSSVAWLINYCAGNVKSWVQFPAGQFFLALFSESIMCLIFGRRKLCYFPVITSFFF